MIRLLDDFDTSYILHCSSCSQCLHLLEEGMAGVVPLQGMSSLQGSVSMPVEPSSEQ